MVQIALSVLIPALALASVLLFLAGAKKSAPPPMSETLGFDVDAHNVAVVRRNQLLDRIGRVMHDTDRAWTPRQLQRRLVRKMKFPADRREVEITLVTLVTNHHTVVVKTAKYGRKLYIAC